VKEWIYTDRTCVICVPIFIPINATSRVAWVKYISPLAL
jgi:hypothetical protein